MSSKKSISFKATESTISKFDAFAALANELADSSTRFNDFFNEITGNELLPRSKGQIQDNDMLELCFSLAIKQLQLIHNQQNTAKKIATTKGVKKSSANDAEVRLSKLVEAILIYNRHETKEKGLGCLGCIFVNGTVLRRDGGFNPALVDRFLNGEFKVTVKGVEMTYTEVEKELIDLGINKDFNAVLRNGLKSQDKTPKIIEVINKYLSIL